MGLETQFDNLDDLNSDWPLGTDPKSEGDNHLRGIKLALKGNITGDGTGTQLKVGARATLLESDGIHELRSNVLGSSNVVRLSSEDGVVPWVDLLSDGTLARLQNRRPGGVVYLTGRNAADGGDVDLLSADPGGAVTLRNNGAQVFNTTSSGIDVRDASGSFPVVALLDDAGGSLGSVYHNSAMVIRNNANGTPIELTGLNGVGSPKQTFNGDPDGAASLYQAGDPVLRTQDHTSGSNSGGQVKDESGTWRPVGFNSMPFRNTSNSETVTSADIGKIVRITGGAGQTVTFPDLGADTTIVAMKTQGDPSTIAAGAGMTLQWLNGGGSLVSGNRTIASGGVATLWQLNSTTWYIWGMGLS